jgi:hypothetical protein
MYYAKPTIAMVNGWCFGGAFTPLICCDLADHRRDAVFGLSEINWGIIPGGVVSKAISTLMGDREALYYVMTGEKFDGKPRQGSRPGQRSRADRQAEGAHARAGADPRSTRTRPCCARLAWRINMRAR